MAVSEISVLISKVWLVCVDQVLSASVQGATRYVLDERRRQASRRKCKLDFVVQHGFPTGSAKSSRPTKNFNELRTPASRMPAQ